MIRLYENFLEILYSADEIEEQAARLIADGETCDAVLIGAYAQVTRGAGRQRLLERLDPSQLREYGLDSKARADGAKCDPEGLDLGTALTLQRLGEAGARVDISLREGRIGEALTLVEVGAKSDPEAASQWDYALGNILRRQAGDCAKAEAAFRRSIELDPKYDHPRLNLAGRLVKSDPAAAIELVKGAPGAGAWEPFVRQDILKPMVQQRRAELCVKFLEKTGLSQKCCLPTKPVWRRLRAASDASAAWSRRFANRR